MPNDLHHIAVFVSNMDKTLRLFQDCLGFELAWRLSRVGGNKLSALLGLEGIEAEMAYLRGVSGSVGVELVRLIHPSLSGDKSHPYSPGTVTLSLIVEDLDGLHRSLQENGWTSLTPPLQMRSPEGEPLKVLCFRTDDGVTIELLEKEPAHSKKEND